MFKKVSDFIRSSKSTKSKSVHSSVSAALILDTCFSSLSAARGHSTESLDAFTWPGVSHMSAIFHLEERSHFVHVFVDIIANRAIIHEPLPQPSKPSNNRVSIPSFVFFSKLKVQTCMHACIYPFLTFLSFFLPLRRKVKHQ